MHSFLINRNLINGKKYTIYWDGTLLAILAFKTTHMHSKNADKFFIAAIFTSLVLFYGLFAFVLA